MRNNVSLFGKGMFPEMAKVGIQVLTLRSRFRLSVLGESKTKPPHDTDRTDASPSCHPLVISYQPKQRRERGHPRWDRRARVSSPAIAISPTTGEHLMPRIGASSNGYEFQNEITELTPICEIPARSIRAIG